MGHKILTYSGLFIFLIISVFIHYKAKSPVLSMAGDSKMEYHYNTGQKINITNFSLENLNGKVISPNDFKDKKPVILYFWKSNYSLCVKSLEELEQFNKNHKEKAEILAINAGDMKLEVVKLAEKSHYTFDILLDEDRKTSLSIGIEGPSIILINKKGQIVYTYAQNNEKASLKDVLENEILPLLEN